MRTTGACYLAHHFAQQIGVLVAKTIYLRTITWVLVKEMSRRNRFCIGQLCAKFVLSNEIFVKKNNIQEKEKSIRFSIQECIVLLVQFSFVVVPDHVKLW